MIAAHFAFLALIAVTPLVAFVDDASVVGVAAIYSAALLSVTAIAIGPGAAAHTFKLLRRPLLLAALPLLWFLIQLLPISFGGVSRSIWDSAATTLAQSLWPHLTIDLGLTVLAVMRFLVIVVVAVVATAVTIDRQNAERCFWIIAVIASLMSVLLALQSIAELAIPGWAESGGPRAVFIAASAFGIVMWTAASIMMLERYETRGIRSDLVSRLLQPVGATLGGAVICAAGALIAGARYAVFAGLCGCLAVGTISFVHRLGLGFRAAMGMGCIGLVAAGAVVWTEGRPAPGMGVAQRYAADASIELIGVANRIATEVGVGGSGAGTFTAIYRLYGAPDSAGGPHAAPTFTSQIAVEDGRFALYAFVLLAAALTLFCVRGALRRGRDSFYSAAGAGVAVAALLTAFCDAALANLATWILFAGVIGLAIGQTASRTRN